MWQVCGLILGRPLSDRILHLLHNLAAVNPENAKSLPELVELTKESPDAIRDLLSDEEASGHVKSLLDGKSGRRYYLTGLGILRAISLLT